MTTTGGKLEKTLHLEQLDLSPLLNYKNGVQHVKQWTKQNMNKVTQINTFEIIY
jgi:hypothetical protein